MTIFYPLWYLVAAGGAASSLLTDLISYWKLDEASGTRVDSVVASGNDLTDNNTVTQAAGKVGNAAQLTRANSEWMDHVSNASLRTGNIDFTLAGWVYFDTVNTYLSVFGKGSVGWEHLLYFEYGLAKALWTVENGASYVLSASALMAATWYYVVVWRDWINSTINMQVDNGAVQTTAYGGGITASTEPFFVGLDVGGTGYMNGRVDELGFWKRVLTATERTNLYNAGAGVTYPFTGVP